MSWGSAISNVAQASGLPALGWPNRPVQGGFFSSPLESTVAPWGGWEGFKANVWDTQGTDFRAGTNVDRLMDRYRTPTTQVDKMATELDRQNTLNHRRRAKVRPHPPGTAHAPAPTTTRPLMFGV
jgi:hypothetical protein